MSNQVSTTIEPVHSCSFSEIFIIITYISHTNTNSDGTAEVMTRVAKLKVAGVGETGVPRGKPTI